LVSTLEQAVVDLLADHGIAAHPRPDAPGVYVGAAKVAALGLRIRHGRAYHGLALNVAMDLAPFGRIDPCGYPGLAVTQLADLGGPTNPAQVAEALAVHLVRLLAASNP
jgi:lipoyl(octanoyl) transferase